MSCEVCGKVGQNWLKEKWWSVLVTCACVKNGRRRSRAGLIGFACLCARACLSDDINNFDDNDVQRSRFCWSPIWPLKELLSVSNTPQQLLPLFLFNLWFRKGTRGHCKSPLYLSPFNYANMIHYHRLKCCGGCSLIWRWLRVSVPAEVFECGHLHASFPLVENICNRVEINV